MKTLALSFFIVLFWGSLQAHSIEKVNKTESSIIYEASGASIDHKENETSTNHESPDESMLSPGHDNSSLMCIESEVSRLPFTKKEIQKPGFTINDAGIINISQPLGPYCGNVPSITPMVSLKNYSTSVLTSATITYQIDNGSPVDFFWTGSIAPSNAMNVSLPSFVSPIGQYTLTVYTQLPNGSPDENLANDTMSVELFAHSPVNLPDPFLEDFEGIEFDSTIYGIYPRDPDGDGFAFERTEDASGFGNGTASAVFDNFSGDPNGTLDWLFTQVYDFTNVSGAALSFDVAYARYSASYSDTLIVAISEDCSTSFTLLYNKGGSDLATAPDETNMFTPTAIQWRTENIDLSAYDGKAGIQIAFINKSGWGNRLFIDNIEITASILPVEITTFNAMPKEGFVNLNWQTASESNNEGFEVLRSKDTENWEVLGFVAGQGTSNRLQEYEYVDQAPFIGTNYYRLRQIDLDGSSEYFEIVSVDFLQESNDWNLRLVPNPVADGNMTLYYSEIKNIDATFMLFDISGRLLKQEPLFGTESTFEIEGIPPGTYFAKVIFGTEVMTEKVAVW